MKKVSPDFLPHRSESDLPVEWDRILPGYLEKDEAYMDALRSGDPVLIRNTKNVLRGFLTEMEQLTMANYEKFSPEVQDLIDEANESNQQLHEKKYESDAN